MVLFYLHSPFSIRFFKSIHFLISKNYHQQTSRRKMSFKGKMKESLFTFFLSQKLEIEGKAFLAGKLVCRYEVTGGELKIGSFLSFQSAKMEKPNISKEIHE